SWFRFFFFQAEDGIRDRNVTGVQTCALPIFGVGIIDWHCDGPAVVVSAILTLFPFDLLIIEFGQFVRDGLALAFKIRCRVITAGTAGQYERGHGTDGSQGAERVYHGCPLAKLEGSVSSGPRNKR